MSHLSAEDVAELRKDTPFDEEDLKQILNRYAEYDSSDKGVNGIDTNIMLTMPEIAMNPLLIRLVHLVKDTNTNRVHPKGYVKFFGYLSSKTLMITKKTVLFRCFDLNGMNRLRHEELFQVYKLMLDYAVDDDQLIRIVNSALEHSCLKMPGEIAIKEFIQIVPDFDILSKFTLDLL